MPSYQAVALSDSQGYQRKTNIEQSKQKKKKHLYHMEPTAKANTERNMERRTLSKETNQQD
jgi:hypothetical protein